jgi:cytoskeletal protein RodZ
VESLGEKLKSAREAKKCTYEQVGRETNIAIRYLEALENEDFTKIPGEPYALGFLKNYGDYLGLDVQELLSLYRAMKIQEQTIPVEQLLQPPRHVPKGLITLGICIIVLALIGAGVYLFFNRPKSESPGNSAVHIPVEYILDENYLERRFYKGDTILVPLENNQYKVEVSDLGETVTLTAPGGNFILDLSQDVQADLNGDGLGDVRVTAADFVKNEPAMGALLRFEAQNNNYVLPEENAPAGQGTELSGTAAAAVPPGANNPVIFSSPMAYPFTLQAAFQGYCMFRWEIDRRSRNERYFVRADELNMQAQNGIRIWVSNAAAVKFQVIGGGRTVPLEIGTAGEVVVADIRWVRDDDGRFRLIQARLEQ